jgi:hypothetical protein
MKEGAGRRTATAAHATGRACRGVAAGLHFASRAPRNNYGLSQVRDASQAGLSARPVMSAALQLQQQQQQRRAAALPRHLGSACLAAPVSLVINGSLSLGAVQLAGVAWSRPVHLLKPLELMKEEVRRHWHFVFISMTDEHLRQQQVGGMRTAGPAAACAGLAIRLRAAACLLMALWFQNAPRLFVQLGGPDPWQDWATRQTASKSRRMMID